MVLPLRWLSQKWIKIPWQASSPFPLCPPLPVYLHLLSDRSLRISTSTWTRIRWKGYLNHTPPTLPYPPWPVLPFSPSRTLRQISSWSLRYWKSAHLHLKNAILNLHLHFECYLFCKQNAHKYLHINKKKMILCIYFSLRKSFSKETLVNAVSPTWSWKSPIPLR